MNFGRNGKEARSILIQFLAVTLIAFGGYMALTHAVKFAKGHFAVEHTEANTMGNSPEKGEASEKNEGNSLYPEQPKEGQRIGKITVPKLGITIPIYEGTDEAELEKGVGHFSESVLPGENNNSVLSGHRDTVFRRLGEVEEGEILIVQTSAGEFTYRVKKIRIVDADDTTVIVPKPEASLTVTTCYPFSYVGDAPERFVLVSELIGSNNGKKEPVS